MSNPLLFFIFIIVIDLVLKSFKDKKKIEKTRQNRQQELKTNVQNKPNHMKPKTNPSRNIISTLREEIEKERQKEIARRQGMTQSMKKPKIEEKEIPKKAYQDKEYWDNKKEQDIVRENNIHKKTETKPVEVELNKNSIKDDIIRGIIFSEILSPPKSVQNQKRSM